MGRAGFQIPIELISDIVHLTNQSNYIEDIRVSYIQHCLYPEKFDSNSKNHFSLIFQVTLGPRNYSVTILQSFRSDLMDGISSWIRRRLLAREKNERLSV